MSSVAVESLVLSENLSKMNNVSPQRLMDRIPLLKYRYRGSSPSGYVATLDKETFAIINTQPTNMQGEHCIMIANSRQILCFADSLGRPSFLKQQYKQMIPEALQSHPSVCGFYAICDSFHLFRFRKKESTEFHEVNVLSFKSRYM